MVRIDRITEDGRHANSRSPEVHFYPVYRGAFRRTQCVRDGEVGVVVVVVVAASLHNLVGLSTHSATRGVPAHANIPDKKPVYKY